MKVEHSLGGGCLRLSIAVLCSREEVMGARVVLYSMASQSPECIGKGIKGRLGS